MVSDFELLEISFPLWIFRTNDGARFVTDIPHGVVRDVVKRHQCCADAVDDLSSMVGYGGLYDVFFRVEADHRQGISDAISNHFGVCGAAVSARWGW